MFCVFCILVRVLHLLPNMEKYPLSNVPMWLDHLFVDDCHTSELLAHIACSLSGHITIIMESSCQRKDNVKLVLISIPGRS